MQDAPKKTVRGRPFGNKNAAKPPEKHRVVMSVSLAPETAKRLRALAKERGVSVGKILDSLL